MLLFTNYIVSHPISLLKAPILFLISGPIEFISKLKEIEYRQKKSELAHKITFFFVLFWVRNLIINLIKLLFFRLLFSLFYLPINIIFFLIFKFSSYLIKPFEKRLKISNIRLKINGISFIIPSWNKKDIVVDCVKSLDIVASGECKNISKEIVVIDNGSVDDTYKALTKMKTNTSLKVIRSNTNLGFARGINLGAKKAKYNYIYLMNNDMIAKPGLIRELIKFAKKLLNKNKLFFGLSSQIFFFDSARRREESGKNYYCQDLGFLYVAHCINENNLIKPSITGYAGGGSSLINKELFLKLGGYDSDLYLPLYDEDLDLSFVAWKFGFPSYFIPSSQIIHHHRSSSKKLIRDPNYFMYKNWLTFILKNYDSFLLFINYIFLYSLRILAEDRFMNYAWQNLKIMPQILYKKIVLSRYVRVYKDWQLINFPKFEFRFENKYEK